MPKRVNHTKVDRTAREKSGYESLRPGQREAIATVLQGRDTLAVMPTGSGKSAIYQIAVALTDGTAIVVSPLIALQQDQVESIAAHDLSEAGVVNSAVRQSELNRTFEELENGRLGYVFLAPEQLGREETLERARRAKPTLFVVDEAHCISEWGHDFRPDYLRLGTAIEALGRPPILALTATAAPEVRDEIVDRLRMRKPRVIVRGSDRPNIWLGVQIFKSESDKRDALLRQTAEAEKPGIVYVATRRHCDKGESHFPHIESQ